MRHDEEAQHLLRLYGNDLTRCMDVLSGQFTVLQTRTQLLLTLATLTLTITGFSGPKIAASGDLARWGLVIGLAVVLVSVILILVGSLRIHWLTQLVVDEDSLAAAIAYRDRKTGFYKAQLLLLVLGLAAYVIAVISYFASGL